MNAQELLERLKAGRKSLDTHITLTGDFIHFYYPRKGWQRVRRVSADRPIEAHLKALNWVEAHS